MEEYPGKLVYEARSEVTLDLTLASLEDTAPAAPVIAEPTSEVALAALERASVTILLTTEPGLATTELTLLTAELNESAAEVRSEISLEKPLDIFLTNCLKQGEITLPEEKQARKTRREQER